MIRVIKTTAYFDKRYKKLAKKVKEKAKERERIFRINPFDFRLRTHKLHGKEKDSWAFWINYSYRIKFVFLDEDSVLFFDIGTHEIYK